jgi:hypothetical protein
MHYTVPATAGIAGRGHNRIVSRRARGFGTRYRVALRERDDSGKFRLTFPLGVGSRAGTT